MNASTGMLRARWSLLMVLVAALLVSSAAVLYTRHVQAQFNCVAKYQTALQQRSVILARIATEDRQQSQAAEANITRLITDAIDANGDRAAGQRAADRYLRVSAAIANKRRQLETQRRNQPFPTTPEKACT